MSAESQTQNSTHLNCNGRSKLPTTSFEDADGLYMAFSNQELDENGIIRTELFRLPDMSCNWSRFSQPIDVRYRKDGRVTDGALAIRVGEVKFDEFAIPVHDPLCNESPENYSHCEVRSIPGNLKAGDEPPKDAKKRKSSSEKQRRAAWRRHLVLHCSIVVPPEG